MHRLLFQHRQSVQFAICPNFFLSVSYNELFDRYVKPTGRNLDILQIERIVYAEKAGDA
jgi:hypothetical protein